MLELAIAEAYRPRSRPPSNAPPRPLSFSTSPNVRASTFSFRSRLPPSALSRAPSAASQPRSFRSFIARRKIPDSVFSKSTEVPEDASRSDSVLRPTTETLEAEAVGSPARSFSPLPELPPSVSLPPQEDLEDFDTVLQCAIDSLQAPSLSSPNDSPAAALAHLAHISDITSCIATFWPEFWAMLVHAVKLLCSARPDTSMAVKNALVRSLAQIAGRWNEDKERGSGSRSSAELARIAGGAIDEMIREMEMKNDKLGVEFARWLDEKCRALRAQVMDNAESRPDLVCFTAAAESEKSNVREEMSLKILTCACSPIILTALTSALSHLPHINILLSALSSPDRPSSSILPSSLPPSCRSRLQLNDIPASKVGAASQGSDIVLLESDCIDIDGSIRSLNGALGAAVCAKMLSPCTNIVILGSVDSITLSKADGTEMRADYEDTEGMETSYESIPARFVDVYTTERGVVEISELNELAKEARELEKHIFGEETV